MTAADWLAVIGETGVLLILLVIVGTGCAMAWTGRLKVGTAPWLRPDPSLKLLEMLPAPGATASPADPAAPPLGTL